jgi:uncharacterized protein (TIGR02145 family)
MAVVQIGSQYWMRENLAVETFQDGTPITECSSSEQWVELASTNTPAWCYYNFDPSLEEEYGKLYNWYVISASNGIAPLGWRVSTESDWNTLISSQGGEKMSGYKLKNKNTWNTLTKTKGDGSNQSGFSANPGGFVKENGQFWDFGWSSNYWTSTTSSMTDARTVRLYWQNRNSIKLDANQDMGFSIRLVHSGTFTGSLDENITKDF